ncbi:protein LAZ1 homolog 2 isoform X1 [Ananas comosus]|uniref:Protein LAZ1 homolog 2 isoform X1 n=1 Tax=Ananas comosus TaxID=4615 RepID=A0A6P5FVX8_ANACO|nr:protein LAZ1 homolog 2 isoform X1 [Ananas comosus]
MAFNRISSFQGIYKNLHSPAVIIGAVFALIAIFLSVLLILQHLRHYSNPAEQKWIIGVLFMVPVYAAESVISLWQSRFSIICEILRNCYEAFALYCFGRYLVACVGGERRVVELLEAAAEKQLNEQLLEEGGTRQKHPRRRFRDFFCHPTLLGKDLYTIIKFGIVQYMILKTVCAFLALLLELVGVYGDGEFKWYYGYPYIAVVINFSQMWALFCLVQFYDVTHERLQPIRPLEKFISFKAIVFATWWQGVGIAIICYFGVLPKEGKIQNGIQDFLICIEMAVAAVAHVHVFSAGPYRYLPISEYGKVTSQEIKTDVTVKAEDDKENQAIVEQKKTRMEAPGTSITESVHDVFIGGGGHVVKDVAFTISQAIEPVEKGVNKIQETFHHISLGPENEKEPKIEFDEHITENVVDGKCSMVSSDTRVEAENLRR